ncbi:hypothetical protein KC19_1G287800 [Ceratodon purpureus]|uniref:Uncharacterized protein n=1 Tax=Ceratodon purpureus TaxID=3225 RepID=A0A8T0JC51_CERPU|nr:hypothetical protein KC19_1G287800 [Ceratodon purpureus]
MAQYSRKQDTEETNCQSPEGPVRCTNNCGFFGSAVTLGMCSKCYRDFVLTQAKASSAKTAEKAGLVISTSEESFGPVRAQVESSNSTPNLYSTGQPEAGAVASSGASAGAGQDPSRPKPNRCFSCKKRVGLTGFECRCGNLFCSAHRYTDKHSCPFDYKAAGQDAIAKANPVVKADKMNKTS